MELSPLKKCYCLKIILIAILRVNTEILILIFGDLLKNLDFWFSELIFISLLLEKNFHMPIYKHQKLAFFLSIFICSPLIL